MARTLWMAIRILLVVSLITIAFGTIVPSNREATPYLSALSNVAVGTAEAIPCNWKRCQGNNCVEFELWGCGFHDGHCASTACFP